MTHHSQKCSVKTIECTLGKRREIVPNSDALKKRKRTLGFLYDYNSQLSGCLAQFIHVFLEQKKVVLLITQIYIYIYYDKLKYLQAMFK